MDEKREQGRSAVLGGVIFGAIFGLATAAALATSGLAFAPSAGIAGLTALLAGGLFALLIGMFMRSRLSTAGTELALEPGERLVHEGAANHFLGAEGRGGRLYLTSNRLVFNPHRFNIRSAGVTIPRADIVRAELTKTLGLVPNGLLVHLKDGRSERFVVNGRAEWVEKLGLPA